MNAPGGIILTQGHKTWCPVQKWGDGREWDGGCDCGAGKIEHPSANPERRFRGGPYPVVQCEKCGVIEHMAYIGYDKRDPATVRFCFSCQIWNDRLKEKSDPGSVVVEGRLYSFDARRPYVDERLRVGQPSTLGFAGARWEIQFFTGRRIVTNNLWFGGDVPAVWRSYFPDNAQFLWRFRSLCLVEHRRIVNT